MPKDVRPDRALSYIQLTNFTPGIYSNWNSSDGEQSAPEGACQIDETVGCIGQPEGGLIAAPRIVNSYEENGLAGFQNVYNLVGNDLKLVILAFRNISPIRWATTNIGGGASGPAGTYGSPIGSTPDYPDFLWTMIQFNRNATISPANRVGNIKALGFKFFQPFLRKVVTTTTWTWAWSDLLDNSPSYGIGFIDVGRSNPSSPTTAGNIVCGWAGAFGTSNKDWGTQTGQTGYGQAVYPDPSAVFHDSVAMMLNLPTASSFNLLAHQGRIITIPSSTTGAWFGSSGGMNAAEVISASQPNNWTSAATVSNQVHVEENPTGIGAWCSMNSSEMFVVKRLGGGYVIRGDIANPSIVRLPGLPPVYDAQHVPVVTDRGVYYGNPFGIWLWTGGDSAQNVSKQLDGWFWHTPIMDELLGNKGSFGYKYPFLFTPNNFIYDVRTRAWWRFGNPDKRVYNWYSPSVNGNILCSPGYVSPDQPTLVDWFNTVEGCHTFTWKSQPIKRTINRYTDFREIDIVSQGVGTVVITLIGLDGNQQAESFTINSANQPISLRKETIMQATDLVVKIESTATDQNNAAPRVDRVSLGYQSREGLAT